VVTNCWQIVMRLSRPDENDSNKRRHFEISIDSPFNIMSCRATQANISLPAYSAGGQSTQPADEFDCGCPGAALLRRNTPPTSTHQAAIGANGSNPNLPNAGVSRSWTNDDGGLAMPSQAHFANDPNSGNPRPIHLLRVPSFNPPSFDEDDPPPPLVTPPPLYDNVVDDPRDALADYFSRLADEEEERSDRSRIDVPLTPGGRVNRSMDISRTWVPLGDTTRPTVQSSVAH
jgi:arrestin-related trafficking adapter 3/6